MSNHETMKQFIKQISGQANMLTIPRLYIEILDGDILAALFLSQSVYWSDKSKRQDGWFYKSAKEWNDDLGLTSHQVGRISDLLVEKKFMQKQLKKANGAPTTHYRVQLDNLMQSVLRFFENQKTGNQIYEKPEIRFGENGKSLTEIIPEITQEINFPNGKAAVAPPAPKKKLVVNQDHLKPSTPESIKVFQALTKVQRSKGRGEVKYFSNDEQKARLEEATDKLKQAGKFEDALLWALQNERTSRVAMVNALVTWAENLDKPKPEYKNGKPVEQPIKEYTYLEAAS